MISKPTRTLLDVASLLGIAWMWIAIYQSFTHTGLWPIVAGALGGAATLPGQAAVLASCVLAGWLSLAIACAAIWRAFLSHRVSADFPIARVQR